MKKKFDTSYSIVRKPNAETQVERLARLRLTAESLHMALLKMGNSILSNVPNESLNASQLAALDMRLGEAGIQLKVLAHSLNALDATNKGGSVIKA